jgi:hypothetical protein
METTTIQSRALAGIDVHKKMLAVVVRRDENGETGYQQRSFGHPEGDRTSDRVAAA